MNLKHCQIVSVRLDPTGSMLRVVLEIPNGLDALGRLVAAFAEDPRLPWELSSMDEEDSS